MTAELQEQAAELRNCGCCDLSAEAAKAQLQYPQYRVWWDRHVVRPETPDNSRKAA